MIKGKITGLRAVEREDLSLLRDWRNIPDFRRNFREHRELNLDNQQAWFDAQICKNPNNFMFIIQRLSDGEPIGACGLLYANWIIRAADFSFYIGHNQAYIDAEGYAEDAAALLIGYGFKNLNLHKLWMELYDIDTLKIAFFTTRMGFSLDGKLRDNCFEDGRYYDSGIYSLLQHEYFARG